MFRSQIFVSRDKQRVYLELRDVARAPKCDVYDWSRELVPEYNVEKHNLWGATFTKRHSDIERPEHSSFNQCEIGRECRQFKSIR